MLGLNPGETAVKPDGSERDTSVLLDLQGIYKLRDRRIAANLASLEESDINADSWANEVAKENLAATPKPEEFDLSWYLLVGALAMVGIELLYLKFRGDL